MRFCHIFGCWLARQEAGRWGSRVNRGVCTIIPRWARQERGNHKGRTHGMVSGDSIVARCFLPSSELSQSIFARAISQVSRTLRLGSDRYSRRIGTDVVDEIAPIASAACPARLCVRERYVAGRHTSCRTIGSSSSFRKTDSRTDNADVRFIWPRQ